MCEWMALIPVVVSTRCLLLLFKKILFPNSVASNVAEVGEVKKRFDEGGKRRHRSRENLGAGKRGVCKCVVCVFLNHGRIRKKSLYRDVEKRL